MSGGDLKRRGTVLYVGPVDGTQGYWVQTEVVLVDISRSDRQQKFKALCTEVKLNDYKQAQLIRLTYY